MAGKGVWGREGKEARAFGTRKEPLEGIYPLHMPIRLGSSIRSFVDCHLFPDLSVTHIDPMHTVCSETGLGR